MKITIEIPDKIPSSEFSEFFVKGMASRMALSYLKYGSIGVAFPSQVDAMKTLAGCLVKYQRTSNTEYLIDAANYAMIEFLQPSLPGAHFEPTESKGSVGRMWHGEIDSLQLPNDVRKHT